jgi:phosphoglycolate phosphatase
MPKIRSQYSLAIFDLDGTLADSFPWFLRVVNDVARDFSFKPIAADDIPAMRRAGAQEILKRVGVPFWKVPRIASHMRKLKRQHLDDIELFEGVPVMLRTLQHSGIRLALVSSDSEANARLQLGASASCFADFACGASLFGKAAKFNRVFRNAGLSPQQTIAIGDEMRDMDAAEEAGIAFGGVAWGYADPAVLRARNPHVWFETVTDITRLLTGREGSACD